MAAKEKTLGDLFLETLKDIFGRKTDSAGAVENGEICAV